MKPLIGLAMDVEDGRGPRKSADPTTFVFVKVPYVDRILEAGGAPILLAPVADDAVIERLLAALDGLVVTGSGIDIPAEMYGHARHEKIGRLLPAKSEFEVRLIRRATALDLPFLGICNGMQAMNVAYGGTLFQDLPSELGVEHAVENATRPCHPVSIAAGTRLHAVLGRTRCEVNSSHHQAVRDVPAALVVSARAGDGVIEGVEDPTREFAVGVQWHPELIPEHAGTRSLFEALIRAASDRASRAERRRG